MFLLYVLNDNTTHFAGVIIFNLQHAHDKFFMEILTSKVSISLCTCRIKIHPHKQKTYLQCQMCHHTDSWNNSSMTRTFMNKRINTDLSWLIRKVNFEFLKAHLVARSSGGPSQCKAT